MRPFWLGVESGACALAAAAFLRWLDLAPFLPELLAQRIFELVPMGMFAFFISTFGAWSKWLAFGGAILVCLALAGVAGEALAPLARSVKAVRLWAAVTALLTTAAVLIGMPLLGVDPLGREMFPSPRIPAIVGILVVSSAYGAWYAWAPLRRAHARARPEAPPS